MSVGAALARQVAVWPVSARLLWWWVRPAGTLIAIAAVAVHIAAGGGWITGVAGGALAMLVRPVRRPWLGLGAAVIVGWLVPAAGIAVAARTVVGAVAVRLAGSSWRAGLDTVVRARRQVLTGIPTPAESKIGMETLSTQTETDALTTMGMAAVTAWTTADGGKMASTAALLLRLSVTGRVGAVRLPFDLDLMRLAVAEWVFGRLPRFVGGVAASGLLAAAWSGWPGIGAAFVVEGGLWAAPCYVLAFALGFTLVGQANVGPGVNSTPVVGALLAVGTWFAAGWAAVTVLACAAGGAAVGRALRRFLMAALYGGSTAGLRLPLWCGSRAGRATWRAAAEARRGGSEYEPDLWSEIADDPAESPALRAGATAALTEIALAAGDLQFAVRRSAEALALIDEHRHPEAIRARVWAAAGRALLAAGNREQARDLLERAAGTRAFRLDTTVQQARLEADGVESAGGNAVTAFADSIAEAARAGDVEGLREILSGDLDDTTIDDTGTRRQLRAAYGRGLVELGSLELERGDHRSAATSLRRAVTGLNNPATAVENAVARTLLGAATSATAPHRALPELAAGVRALEARRGALADGLHRSGLIVRHARVYEQVFTAASVLQRSGQPAAAVAAEVTESLRRGSLATTLRTGSTALSDEVLRLRGEVEQLEARQPADGAADLHPAIDPDLDRVRAELRAELSALFARAYVPEPVHLSALPIAYMHVLAYHLHEVSASRIRGHIVWLPPGAAPEVAAFAITEPELLDLVGVPGGAVRRAAAMAAVQDDEQVGRWTELGRRLLPSRLRQRFTALPAGTAERVTIVPHGPLSALPWAALRLDDDRPLVTVAELQLVPSLAFLRDTPPGPGGTGPVVVHLAEPASGRETRELALLESRAAGSKEEFLYLLAQRPAGAYLAAHGQHEGLAQAVTFGGGGVLSAAAALGHRWPSWVVFASCLVGRIDHTLGAEPLGLPISCVLGGADTVVGGVIEVGYTAGALAARVAVQMSHGAHPAAALRSEQIRQLDRGARAPLTAWAGLICISRLPASIR